MNNRNGAATFYIVRHGETDWNAQGKIQGHTDIPLNEKGELQARELAEELKHITFDLVFSSDLLRAKRTAEIIVLERKMTVQTTKVLRERMFGEYEGVSHQLLRDLFAKMRKSYSSDVRLKQRAAEGIESDEELTTRIITFIRETAVANPGKKILLGTHGGIISVLLVHLGYISYEDLENIRMINAGYVRLETDGVEFDIKEVKGLQIVNK